MELVFVKISKGVGTYIEEYSHLRRKGSKSLSGRHIDSHNRNLHALFGQDIWEQSYFHLGGNSFNANHFAKIHLFDNRISEVCNVQLLCFDVSDAVQKILLSIDGHLFRPKLYPSEIVVLGG